MPNCASAKCAYADALLPLRLLFIGKPASRQTGTKHFQVDTGNPPLVPIDVDIL